MSYILEALRRAESERERKRGGVPGLHANPVPAPSPDDRAEGRARPWTWVAGGLTVGVLLMILWRWWSVEPLVDEAALARAPVEGNVSQGNAAPPPPTQAAPSPAPAPAEPAPPAAAGTTPAPKASAGGAPLEDPARSRKPATPPRNTATAVAAPRNPPAAPAQPPAPGPTAAAQPNQSAPMPSTPPGAQTPVARNPPPAPERLRTLAELPDDLRRSVPQLAFGGSVYSDTPAQRMVILNGQVMREGDAINEELQVEQIRPRSAVMRVRGQRFEMPF